MNKEEILSYFKTSLRNEAQAILNSIDYFSFEVIDAISLIKTCQGKLVITGIGKGGHIGKKIAASMSSMGTPAVFMHAVEAMHGDLGMVQPIDVVMLISNSGETQEVLNLVSPLKKRGIKLIALTRSHESTLAKQSDVSLAYHYSKECDHLHLAPTVSSTLTLAVGDALAITLCKLKNFTEEDFHQFHPGGSLGKLLEKK